MLETTSPATEAVWAAPLATERLSGVLPTVQEVGSIATNETLTVSFEQDVPKEVALLHSNGVEFGLPPNFSAEVPNKPYAFDAAVLAVDSDDTQVPMGTMRVLMAHGIVTQNGEWQFKSGTSVVDTVNTINEQARMQGLPPIEVLAVCNNDPSAVVPNSMYVSKLHSDVLHVKGSDAKITPYQDPQTGQVELTISPASKAGKLMSSKRGRLLQQGKGL